MVRRILSSRLHVCLSLRNDQCLFCGIDFTQDQWPVGNTSWRNKLFLVWIQDALFTADPIVIPSSCVFLMKKNTYAIFMLHFILTWRSTFLLSLPSPYLSSPSLSISRSLWRWQVSEVTGESSRSRVLWRSIALLLRFRHYYWYRRDDHICCYFWKKKCSYLCRIFAWLFVFNFYASVVQWDLQQTNTILVTNFESSTVVWSSLACSAWWRSTING